MHLRIILLCLISLFPLLASLRSGTIAAPDAGIYLTNGIKIGDVTGTTAILWTRTCATPNGNHVPHDHKNLAQNHPEQCLPPKNIKNIAPADRPAEVRGRAGFVRFTLTPPNGGASSNPVVTGWLPTGPDDDYCVQTTVAGLSPNIEYKVTAEAITDLAHAGRARALSSTTGKFRTAPPKTLPAAVTAVVTSCQYFWDHDDEVRGFKIYDSMARLKPDFIVQQGDYVYYDRKGIFTTSIEMARAHWHAQNTWPSILDFYKTHAAYFTKDDHDTLFDDANPHTDFSKTCGSFRFADGVKIYNEQLPQPRVPYRTIRWGKDLQFWLLESREYRTTENNAPDGPDKSLLGPEQKAWLARTLAESDAAFKIIMSPTAIVGPDFTEGKNDNHSNLSWTNEGDQIRRLLARHGAIVINGDRHWQYHSIDPKTGLREFSKGPASTQHTIGRVWNPDDFRDLHHYLRVAGGFLSFTVERKDNIPQITLNFHDVDGLKNYSRTYDVTGKILGTYFNTANPDAGRAR